MLEADAKTRWCPFVRAVTGKIDRRAGTSDHRSGQPTYNRVVDGTDWVVPQGALCTASACMMWRHERMMLTDTGYGVAAPPGSGYCGLAGRPE